LTTLKNGLQRDQQQIALEVGLERSNVADVISRLEGRGLVRRIDHSQDRRRKVVKLTPKGARLLNKMEASVQRAHMRTIDALPEASRQIWFAPTTPRRQCRLTWALAKIEAYPPR